MLTKLRLTWTAWREQRFLKKHHVTSRKMYERYYDLDIAYSASEIRNYFHGYGYLHAMSNRQLLWHHDHLREIDDWCTKNCVGKWRREFFRVSASELYEHDWIFDELGGGDVMFVAFKESRDYILFSLRWV